MSVVTTAPAPMTTRSQTFTGISVALVPTLTWLPSRVARHCSRLPAGPPVVNGSLMNIAPCDTKQSSPIVTSSQMKACDWMRQRLPMTTSRWISTNGPMKLSSPVGQPQRVTGCMMLTLSPKMTSTMPTDRSRGSPMISGSRPRVRRVGALEDGDDRAGVGDACLRLLAGADALEEVLGLQAERLDEVHVRQQDVAAAIAEVRAQRLVEIHVLAQHGFAVDALVVDGDLVVGHVVVHHHLARDDHRHLADFLRIQPAHVYVGDHLARVGQVQEHDVVDTGLDAVH